MTVIARRHCRDPAEAERLRRALAPDTPDFVRITVEGSDLILATEGSSAASVRATFEDLLPCLQAAERVDPQGKSTASERSGS